MEIKHAGSQSSNQGPTGWFTGAGRIEPLFQASAPARVVGASRNNTLVGFGRKNFSALLAFFQLRFLSALLLTLALLTGGCVRGPRGMPAAHGIANYGQVNPMLLRGAQPDEPGIATLQRLGVTTIINLRRADDVVPDEEAAAHRHGLTYVNVPLPGFSAPTDAAVSHVLALIATAPGPVFVHCEHGADRTGTIIACYRIRHDGWTVERALAETRQYGMSVWEFGMKRYVEGFAAAAHTAP